MDRLSTLDAEFLHLEDGVAHMHIAGACVFDDPSPGFAEVEALIASKLHLIPRYRQRVRTVPFEFGRPVWVDDASFDLGYHLRHTALPAPGDDAAFCRLMGRLMSQPLDRDRPLWEAWIIENLDNGRWALVFKVHHCMVDGIAGVELLTVMLDLDAATETVVPEPWIAAPEPHGAIKVLSAWGGLASDIATLVAQVPRVVTHPTETIHAAADTVGGLARFVTNLRSTKPLSIDGSIGPHRSWSHSCASVSDVRTIRDAFGGTINDVVLAAVAGGYRQLLLSRGEVADDAVVRSMVPVSTRHLDGQGVPDNRVSMILYDLPVHISDPVERLSSVREKMSELKSSHMAEAGEMLFAVGNLAPPMVVGAVSRLSQARMRGHAQHVINTVTTNVPGPQFPLYCLGSEMLEYRPFVGISHGVRVSTAILSYNGQLFFGITGDLATTPDVDVLAVAVAAGVDELRDRALVEQGRRTRA